MKTTVRFVTKVGTGFRELVSVYENKNGSLIIAPKGGGFIDRGGASDNRREIKDQKYSIHINEMSADGGNTFHHTTLFVDGGLYETHAYTLAIKNERVWPLYFHNFLHPGQKKGQLYT